MNTAYGHSYGVGGGFPPSGAVYQNPGAAFPPNAGAVYQGWGMTPAQRYWHFRRRAAQRVGYTFPLAGRPAPAAQIRHIQMLQARGIPLNRHQTLVLTTGRLHPGFANALHVMGFQVGQPTGGSYRPGQMVTSSGGVSSGGYGPVGGSYRPGQVPGGYTVSGGSQQSTLSAIAPGPSDPLQGEVPGDMTGGMGLDTGVPSDGGGGGGMPQPGPYAEEAPSKVPYIIGALLLLGGVGAAYAYSRKGKSSRTAA